LHGKREFWGRWRNACGLSFNSSLQIHWLRRRGGARRVLPQRLSPMGGRGSRSDCLRGMLSSLSLEDLPLSGVFIVRNYLHYPLSLVRGAEEAPASASARGMAAIGGGELGGGLVEGWTEGVDGVVAD